MFEFLPFLDSFDHYLYGQMTRKWTSAAGSIMPGRNGNGFGGVNASCSKSFSAGYSRIYAGLAYYTAGFGNDPIRLGTVADQHHLKLLHYGDGRLIVQCGFTGPQSAPSEWVMHPNTWYYLELSAIISPLGGSNWRTEYEARANNATILSGSFTRTIPNFPGHVNIFSFTGVGGGSITIIDDVCILADGFPGDVDVGVIRPNAEGDLIEFTPNTGTMHWDLVKDTTPDDDTTYLSAASAGLREMHHYADIPTDVIVVAAQCMDCLKKNDTGTASVRSRMKNGAGVTYTGSTFYPSDASFLYHREGFRKSPFTGLDWTPAEINALQRGTERLT